MRFQSISTLHVDVLCTVLKKATNSGRDSVLFDIQYEYQILNNKELSLRSKLASSSLKF